MFRSGLAGRGFPSEPLAARPRVLAMITEKQLKKRLTFLGSSDIPAIMGHSRFRSAYDIWLEKIGSLAPSEPSEAAIVGQVLEPSILKLAARGIGKIVGNRHTKRLKKYYLGSHADGIVVASKLPVEVKCEGQYWATRDGWGEAGSDDVPYEVILQTHVHMMCSGADACYVAALLGGKGFKTYFIEKDVSITEFIADRAEEFWRKYVIPKVPPPDSVPSKEVVRRIRKHATKTISIPIALLDRWRAAKDAAKLAKDEADDEECMLLAALSDAEEGLGDDGTGVTHFEYTRKTLDAKALMAEHPEIYQKFVKETPYRRLVYKKNGRS